MKKKIKEEVNALKKKMILEAAQEYIEKNGYQNFKINDLSKVCEISVGALYQLFESKENLFYEYVLFQMEKFHSKLLSLCSGTNSPKQKILIYTKLKLQTFKEKGKVIQEHINYDPLFILKLGNQDKAVNLIEHFLADEFKNLSKETPLKTDNYIRLSYAFCAYILGFIKYHFIDDSDKEYDIDKLSYEIVENFLYGYIKS
jgi:AcrR family transcriptional regulator